MDRWPARPRGQPSNNCPVLVRFGCCNSKFDVQVKIKFCNSDPFQCRSFCCKDKQKQRWRQSFPSPPTTRTNNWTYGKNRNSISDRESKEENNPWNGFRVRPFFNYKSRVVGSRFMNKLWLYTAPPLVEHSRCTEWVGYWVSEWVGLNFVLFLGVFPLRGTWW